MRTILAAVTALTLIATAPAAFADDAKDLQGSWKIMAVEAAGNEVPVERFTLDSVVIKGNQLALVKGGKAIVSVTYGLDATTSPKKMNWTKEEFGSMPAIYELDGASLRICFPLREASKENDIPVPESFDTKGKKLATLTLQKK